MVLASSLIACAPTATQKSQAFTHMLVLLDANGAPSVSYEVEKDGLHYTFDPKRTLGIRLTVRNQNVETARLLWYSSRFNSSGWGTTPIYLSTQGSNLDQVPEPQEVSGGQSFTVSVSPSNSIEVSAIQHEFPGLPESTSKIVFPRPFLSDTEPVTMSLVWNISGSLYKHTFSFKQKLVPVDQ